MPFLYFFGQFTYQLPFYNNKPKHEDSEKPIEFQPGRWISDEEKKELKKKNLVESLQIISNSNLKMSRLLVLLIMMALQQNQLIRITLSENRLILMDF